MAPISYAPASTINIRSSTNAKLDEAKSFEYKDDEKALAIYLSLAGENVSEAQYGSGLMLLEGRGTVRQFRAARGYINNAAGAGHVGAKKILAGVESRLRQLNHIADTFSELNAPDAPGAPVSTSKMPVKLQRAAVETIMSDKKGNDTESLTITHDDITMALGDMAGYFMDSSCEKTALEEYQRHDIGSLLSDGVHQYNQEKGTSIGIQTEEPPLPPEMWRYIEPHMSVRPNLNLAGTSHSYLEIYKVDGLWQAKRNEAVIELLLRLGITDRMLIQKVRDGQLTLAEIQDVDQQTQTALKSPLLLHKLTRRALMTPWLRARVFDRVLTVDQLTGITATGYQVFCDPEIQSWLELEQNQQYIDKIVNLSPQAGRALKNAWVRGGIGERLSFAKLAGITEAECIALCDPQIQNFLDRQALSGAIDAFTVDKLAGITSGGCRALRTREVQNWLELNPQHIDQVTRLPEWAGAVLRVAQVRECIDNGIFLLGQFHIFTQSEFTDFYDSRFQKVEHKQS